MLTDNSKRDSPVGEVTTTSEYFASNGKSKPARSTPNKSKATSKVIPREIPPSKSPATRASASKANPLPQPFSNGRTSSRKKTKQACAVSPEPEEEDFSSKGSEDFNPGLVKEDEASGDDIFGADYKGRSMGDEGDYQSQDEEDVAVQQSRRTIRSNKNAAVAKKLNSSGESDILMKDIESEKQSVEASMLIRRKT